MARYDPLTRYLRTRAGDEVSVPFSEIEALLARPLPPSARRHQAWWANTDSHAHAAAWLGAGWRTERLDLAGERIFFVRDRMAGLGERLGSESALLILPEFLNDGARWLIETEAAQKGTSRAEAAAALINEAVLERRRAWMRRLAANAPRVDGDSTDLIREDRDAR